MKKFFISGITGQDGIFLTKEIKDIESKKESTVIYKLSFLMNVCQHDLDY